MKLFIFLIKNQIANTSLSVTPSQMLVLNQLQLNDSLIYAKFAWLLFFCIIILDYMKYLKSFKHILYNILGKGKNTCVSKHSTNN